MKKLHILIPEDLLEALDSIIASQHYERSEFIRKLIRDVVYPKDTQEVPSVGEVPQKITPITPPTPVIVGEHETVGEFQFRISEGWCQGHFERGVNHKRYLVTWEDENGDVKIDHKWYCKECLDRLFNLKKGKIYGQ